ncbi:GSCOCG00007474001-RA-CDS [Cotesia congregata]|nr:GSCOCG00007474001-RA-CDS [Cotesia congregata]
MSDFTWKFSGSCSLRIPELDDEFKFFKKSIDLYDKFSIGKNLEDKDIIIGGDYSIEEISDAISGVLGGNYAQLGCTEGKNWWKDLNYPRFNELIIFLDKQFSPIKNPGWRKHGYRLQDCQRNVTVYYDV